VNAIRPVVLFSCDAGISGRFAPSDDAANKYNLSLLEASFTLSAKNFLSRLFGACVQIKKKIRENK